MPIADLLHNAPYLTNSLGEQTDVVISIDTWKSLLAIVQETEQLNRELSPSREQWLWENPEAQAALAQAAQGETQSLGSFAQYANLDIED
jgi:elongation factor P--beta-lysine ligase